MARKYHTLVSRDDAASRWGIEFGDYDRETVEQERDALISGHLGVKRLNTKIITTKTARQADINAAVAAMNSKGAE